MKKPAPTGREDPQPYSGPIERADGRRPYNMYLWPSEQWVAHHEGGELRNIAFHLGHINVVHLADGRFSTEGSVRCIEDGKGYDAKPCVFGTRAAAIRKSCATAIRTARRAARHADHFGRFEFTTANASAVVNWALRIAATECEKPQPQPVQVRPATPPPPKPTGLDLLDQMIGAT